MLTCLEVGDKMKYDCLYIIIPCFIMALTVWNEIFLNSGFTGNFYTDNISRTKYISNTYKNACNNECYASDYLSVCLCNKSFGFIEINYVGVLKNAVIIITHSDSDRKKIYHFTEKINPNLTFGDGIYSLQILTHHHESFYREIFNEKINVSLSNHLYPFLIPSPFVWYDNESYIVKSLFYRVSPYYTCDEIIKLFFNFITNEISYDYEFAFKVHHNLITHHVPNLDKIMSTKTGVCFDKASLFTALLRLNNIPSRLIIGYYNDELHAWVEIWNPNYDEWIAYDLIFNNTSLFRMRTSDDTRLILSIH